VHLKTSQVEEMRWQERPSQIEEMREQECSSQTEEMKGDGKSDKSGKADEGIRMTVVPSMTLTRRTRSEEPD
jgi:hypothetical protein